MQIFLSFILGIVTVLSGYGFYTNTTPREVVEGLGSMMSGSLDLNSTFVNFTKLVPNASFVDSSGTMEARATTTIYTVPVGKKLMVYAVGILNKESLTTTIKVYKESGGVYDFIGGSLNISSLGRTTTLFGNSGFVLNEGENLAVVSSTSSINYFGMVGALIPSTSTYKTIATSSITTSTTTLYTVPVGKTAYIVPTNSAISYISISNNTGVNVNYTTYVGTSATTTTLRSINVLANTGTSQGVHVDRILSSGESIYVASGSDLPGQYAWVTLYEY